MQEPAGSWERAWEALRDRVLAIHPLGADGTAAAPDGAGAVMQQVNSAIDALATTLDAAAGSGGGSAVDGLADELVDELVDEPANESESTIYPSDEEEVVEEEEEERGARAEDVVAAAVPGGGYAAGETAGSSSDRFDESGSSFGALLNPASPWVEYTDDQVLCPPLLLTTCPKRIALDISSDVMAGRCLLF